jgi:phosphoribosyl-ATP pyrophosphohydrolase
MSDPQKEIMQKIKEEALNIVVAYNDMKWGIGSEACESANRIIQYINELLKVT